MVYQILRGSDCMIDPEYNHSKRIDVLLRFVPFNSEFCDHSNYVEREEIT